MQVCCPLTYRRGREHSAVPAVPHAPALVVLGRVFPADQQQQLAAQQPAQVRAILYVLRAVCLTQQDAKCWLADPTRWLKPGDKGGGEEEGGRKTDDALWSAAVCQEFA